jgi:hypothetical protein
MQSILLQTLIGWLSSGSLAEARRKGGLDAFVARDCATRAARPKTDGTHVERLGDGLRTRVQFPPAPPLHGKEPIGFSGLPFLLPADSAARQPRSDWQRAAWDCCFIALTQIGLAPSVEPAAGYEYKYENTSQVRSLSLLFNIALWSAAGAAVDSYGPAKAKCVGLRVQTLVDVGVLRGAFAGGKFHASICSDGCTVNVAQAFL